jgi:LemA protein
MNSKTIRTLIIVGVVLIAFLWIKGSFNSLVDNDEKLTNSWNNVEVAYQTRADKIVQIAEAVSAEAKFEKTTLTEITNARASVGQIKVGNEQLTPESIDKIAMTQQSALSRLMVVMERYPDLKATKGYENLQFEISESENMIRTARTDYNAAVLQYNLNVRKFPSNIFAGIFGFEKKSGFASDKGSEKRVNIKDALKD